MKKLLLFALLMASQIQSQSTMTTKLPYYEIPEYPESYTAGSVAARLIDGLGFRYYWATQGLTEMDLAYKPNQEVRSTNETIEHIYNLSNVIVNAALKQPNTKNDISQMTFDTIRKQTLINIKTAADVLRLSDDISQYKIIFGEREIPFWNNINGPIADAIWHCGQIVSFRRTTENPINPNVDHFMGTVKE